MNKKWVILADAIISIVLIAAILYFMDISKVANTIINVNLFFLALSIVFLLVMYGVMIFRIKLMLDEIRVITNWNAVIRSHWVGMLLADFTPARSGYFATAGMLHYNYKVPSDKALVAIFGPQIFDFTLKVIASTAGIVFIIWNLLGQKQNPLFFLGSGVMALIVILMLLLLFSEKFLRLFSFSKKFPLIGKIYDLFEKMQMNSHAVIKKTPELLILLLISWTAKAISWYFVAKAVGVTVNFPIHEVFFYFFFQPIVTILEFMPLPTIAGAGTSEAVGVFIMLLFGIPKEISFSFLVLTRTKTILVNLIAVPDLLRVTKNALKTLF